MDADDYYCANGGIITGWTGNCTCQCIYGYEGKYCQKSARKCENYQFSMTEKGKFNFGANKSADCLASSFKNAELEL